MGIAANGAFQRWLVSFRRLHDILDLEEEPLDGRDMGFELRAESGILARGVVCRPGGHSVYEDLDLELGSRGLYVMSGESGKGKTTFFRLLTGIYPYESGTLCLFGRSLREYSLKSLQSQIVYMTQEDALFQGTVRDNILWRTRADDGKVLALLERLGLDRWILGLEKGLETHVVNGGAEFSGGQRKCLLLARALLEDSAVYLLDEPFAGVDRQHSLLIWKELERVARNALVIAISHDQFLPEGPIFISRDAKGREKVKNADADCIQLPLVVLVNRESYSAAEFTAAMLQESGRATVVGVQTYGKGYAQQSLKLLNDSAIHISTSCYYLPSGRSLAGTGLTPDVVRPLSQEDEKRLLIGSLPQEEDAQLQAALSALLDGV